jgi:two-component system, chemotaxis family, protein-glutamate methylesterase/glutaminase
VPGHDIITIGASAGGVETLISLVRGLPFNLPAAIFVVVHFPPHSSSLLPDILNSNSSLPAGHAQHGELIQTGRIYVATSDYHLLVRRGAIHIVRGPRENHCRPAIDPLFRSAALAYGPRVIGVILSGTLGDGTAGLFAVKEQGGIAIVQDPQDALFPEMPRNAMSYVQCDYVVPVADLADLLIRLSHEPVEEISMVSNDMEKESAVAEIDLAAIENQEKPGVPSTFACPDCGDTLWELQDGELLRFRCRTGHAFSSESLLAVQNEALEGALWAALRGLEENAALAQRVAARTRASRLDLAADKLEQQAKKAQEQAAIIRQLLLSSQAVQDEKTPLETNREKNRAGD